MYRLTKRLQFEAAHRIPDYPGKCRNLHGHTYFVDVEVCGEDLDRLGILLDFNEIAKLKEILPDHSLLNESLPEGVNTTTEGLSRYLFGCFREALREVPRISLSAVTVHEGPNSWCRFEED
ncbi:MAG TPA: 6-carboxytetrahydropterin synthase [Chroococcales cyanobacterium]|jgi:6-pyruvoyltetrahydropterin/6-carboxytetrahydropterin synthase